MKYVLRALAASIAAVLGAGGLIIAILAAVAVGADSPPRLAADAVAAVLVDHLPRAVPIIAYVLAPFPLAGVLALCVFLAAFARTRAPAHLRGKDTDE